MLGILSHKQVVKWNLMGHTCHQSEPRCRCHEAVVPKSFLNHLSILSMAYELDGEVLEFLPLQIELRWKIFLILDGLHA